MVRKRYVPDRGDLVWVTFDPQVGREQAGRRPALILSPATYNGKVGLAVACPITSKLKGYSFEVTVPDGAAVTGAILADHVHSLDWQGRRAVFIGKLDDSVVRRVAGTLARLLPLA